ncbi:LysM peptidoglycan-binding domain-containing protein [Ligilactobacillus ruminis]|jgi:LysM repeat protein|uniref:LysM peptidoglycan-binding domain-containing protein n=2 Tax=Ligilactobacillus ruminis TaxID=1623 RepID=A0A3E4M644_9LACO|nr:LysM peptidoglycan-binding domain-containing protein [Ligilactobacillus ruminis]MSB43522.1 LysM peptidoglycan-binding domain-containing protein [Ligilactobacillus ruminis]MSB54338.1 LysM peptidoglycan-binding domain-containing protein [Ligilactobacillus ruminis]MSB56210.1 LysM peptidoglycan-binding domain-containing protein [Ligilactobacillus ruminis]MSB81258.1 LysM peptidoglycan-binding domain-containing protein [Ligilactobacillus ruminis]
MKKEGRLKMTVENTQAVDQSAYLQVLNQANAGSQATQAQQFSNTLKKIQVKYGDTVSELAEQYGTTTDAIVQANNLRDPNFILAGQNLVIPAQGQSVQAVSQAQTVESTGSSSSSESKVSAVGTGESSAEASARAWIVQRESGGDYNARNGKYIGKYQLDKSYLNGDYSPANQEKTAERYVKQRYGSWVNAQKHWQTHNWY